MPGPATLSDVKPRTSPGITTEGICVGAGDFLFMLSTGWWIHWIGLQLWTQCEDIAAGRLQSVYLAPVRE